VSLTFNLDQACTNSESVCPICGETQARGETTFTVDLGFGVVVVRNVPALICEQCGADWIEDEIARQLEKTVMEARQHRRQVEVTAFMPV
jgi:YgiT-type zinc finger domain-containing protein